jgi:hypothetical protein
VTICACCGFQCDDAGRCMLCEQLAATDPRRICVHSLTLLGDMGAGESSWPTLAPDHETEWRIDLRDPPRDCA